MTGAAGNPDTALYSRFVQRLHRRHADSLALLPAGAPSRDGLLQAHAALVAQGHDTAASLRILRQITLERLVQLDCVGHAPLE